MITCVQDHKHSHSNQRSYHFIRPATDRICKEHGLSVMVPGGDKGQSCIEHQAEQNGTGYKELCAAIDRLLPTSADLENRSAGFSERGTRSNGANTYPPVPQGRNGSPA